MKLSSAPNGITRYLREIKSLLEETFKSCKNAIWSVINVGACGVILVGKC